MGRVKQKGKEGGGSNYQGFLVFCGQLIEMLLRSFLSL